MNSITSQALQMPKLQQSKQLQYVNGNFMKVNVSNQFDEYFTKPDIAQQLLTITKEVISTYDDIHRFFWIEPSVGDGCFFDLLPKDNKIGLDINPRQSAVISCDYLQFDFSQKSNQLKNKPIIVIGNPPFGHRGVLALEFIKHSQQADYVAFILPMFFKSLGKGSIRYRVQDFNLLYEQDLPQNSFYTKDNKSGVAKNKDIKCCFQVWSKKHKNNNSEFSWYNNDNKKQNHLIKLLIFTQYPLPRIVNVEKSGYLNNKQIFIFHLLFLSK